MTFRDFIGGSLVGVLVRLLLLSLFVGLLLSFFGVTPRNFFYVIDDVARSIYAFLYTWSDWILGYIVLGAMVVVPLWVIARLLRAGTRRPPPRDDQV